MQSRRPLALWVAAAAAAPLAAQCVTLDAGGRGQALIYPYYTVQAASGNAFNTYLSVVNHSSTTDKALRIRFRESRNGREVASLNLFLGRNDVWTGALIPDGEGTRLVSRDLSCTEPLLWSGQLAGVTHDGLAFRNAAFSGANADGAGEGLDRTREGYIEILEMATLQNGSPFNLATAISHTIAGPPANCGIVQAAETASTAPAGTFTAPSGDISGTLTLINVANGMDASVNAEALGQLATRPYFRTSADPYPAFNAAEIDPVSLVLHEGAAYRSTWARGVDAVSAVLMRRQVAAEWTLERVTASQTDYVITLPTRPFYMGSAATRPFSSTGWAARCAANTATGYSGELFSAQYFDRGQRGATISYDFFAPNTLTVVCAAAAVAGVENGSAPPASLLGSQSRGLAQGTLQVNTQFETGVLRLAFLGSETPGSATLVSEPDSTRVDMATGVVAQGRHTFRGMPVTGFAIRTLRNGTLGCGAASCQGNYASAFPYTYTREISAP